MIDIIMPCHGHLEYAIQAVEALKRNTDVPYRLTIVDDSPGIEGEYLSKLGANYVRPQVKITEGNQNVNIGLQNTLSDPVVFMAQNTFVEPQWCGFPLQIMANDPKIALVGIKLLYQNGIIEHAGIVNTDYGWGDIGRGEPGHRYSFITEVPAVGFALVFINRKAFPDGFPEKLYPHGFAGPDDVDACLSIREQGWKVVYCGLSSAYHIANAIRNKDEDYNRKVEECRQFFLSRWNKKKE